MVTIELRESVVAGLTAQAKAAGLTLVEYLEKLAELPVQCPQTPLTADELDRLLDADTTDTTTYEGTYPRSDIYLDHD